jgi:RNA polymerase sigma-70 factor (ECF subfamily)
VSSEQSEPSSGGRFARLIGRARAGNRDAVADFIGEYRDYLLLIANKYLDFSIRAKLGPSDVVQQTMLAALERLDQFRGESEAEFRAWIRQILKNDLLDANRRFRVTQRRQVGRETSLDDSRQAHPEALDQANTPGTDALLREQAELLNRSMSQLPEAYQQVLRLRNWQELSFAEIGLQLDCSPEAARKLWYRAVLKLQKAFHKLAPGLKSSLLQTMTNQPDVDEQR